MAGIGAEYGTTPLPALRKGLTGSVETFTAGGVKATGTVTFSVNPTAGDTVTLNGTVFTFVASGATGNQVNIGVDLATTLTSAAVVYNASVVAGVALATYTENGTVVTVTYDTYAAAGNTYTLAASAATASGATLTGGQDIQAISVATEPTLVALTQAVHQYFTLADGEESQRKLIYSTLGSTGDAIITPANLAGGTIITLGTTKQYVELRFMSGEWYKVAGDGVVS